MRYVFLAAAAVAACGGSGNGLSSVAATNVTVTVAILGPGVVRGGGLSADCDNNCSFVVPAGTTVHLLSVPEPNATFSGWSGPCNGLASCDLLAQADVTVGAIFARMEPPPPPERSATLSVDLSGSGNVVSTPAGIDCPRVCSATFAAETDVVLTATAADGFSFGGFSAPCSGAACSIHLAADDRVAAAFMPIPVHQIAVALSGSGAGRVTSTPPGIDCPGTCAASFREGTTVVFAATPDPLSKLAGFTGACAGNSCSVKVQADTAAVARFENRRYVVMDLGVVPGAWWSGASSISPNGRFVTGNVGGQNDVFVWGGVMQALGLGFGFAGGVNDAGVVAGTFEPDPQTGAMQGFRWRLGATVALGTLGGASSQVSAINRDGVIVGWALRADGIQRAVFWNGGSAVDLGSLGGGFIACSVAYGINAAGTIVGESCMDNGSNHPVRFRGPGAIDDLGTLGGSFGIASAINDSGVIVGYSSDSSGVYRGFVYQDGRMIDAGSLPGLPFSELGAINGKGVAVGLAFNGSGVQRAVAYAAGRMIDLNTVVDGTPYTLNSMGGIDEAGDIVGSGIDNGLSRAVILRPQ